MTNKAVFLDRDGTINYPVYNIESEEYEPPRTPEYLKLYPFAITSLKRLQDMGYLLFLISNQPDAAKGKNTMENLLSVHYKLQNILAENKIWFKDFYYCFHHPSVSECECRKPSPYFIKKAEKEYNLDLKESWMIGDRETDVICGKEAGTKTIKLGNPKSKFADFTDADLEEAVEIIKFCDVIKVKKENKI